MGCLSMLLVKCLLHHDRLRNRSRKRAVLISQSWYHKFSKILTTEPRLISHVGKMSFVSYEFQVWSIDYPGFEILLIQSSPMSKYDCPTSGLTTAVVRQISMYFWSPHDLQWLVYISDKRMIHSDKQLLHITCLMDKWIQFEISKPATFATVGFYGDCTMARPGPVFCLLFRVSSGCARPITGQVTLVTWPVIGWA